MNNENEPLNIAINITFIILIIFMVFGLAKEAEADTERHYQNKWCTMGKVEFRLKDNTRVDCLTDDFAIEFDFAHKWPEAVGQSLHYSFMTNRRPGIVLIMKSDNDMKYWKRMNNIIWDYRLPINVWMIRAE